MNLTNYNPSVWAIHMFVRPMVMVMIGILSDHHHFDFFFVCLLNSFNPVRSGFEKKWPPWLNFLFVNWYFIFFYGHHFIDFIWSDHKVYKEMSLINWKLLYVFVIQTKWLVFYLVIITDIYINIDIWNSNGRILMVFFLVSKKLTLKNRYILLVNFFFFVCC